MAVENQFSTVGRVIYTQVFTALIVTLGFGLVGGWNSMLSPLLGCGVAIIPNLYFAYKVYLARFQDAQGIVNAFYTGETVKLLLTGALFMLVIQIPGVNFLTLLIGYVAVLSVFWFALFYWRG
jgi:ATP synthase protein I